MLVFVNRSPFQHAILLVRPELHPSKGHHDIQHNGTQHNNKWKATLNIMALSTRICYAECRKQAHRADCHYAECRYGECRSAE